MHKYKKIPKTLKLKKRFESKITKGKPNECWEWQGTIMVTGYGCVRYNYGLRKNTVFLAHRVSYVLYKKDKLVNGLVVDHICKNRKCVNPNHLRQMSINDNAQRDIVKSKKFNYSSPHLLFKGYCDKGHQIKSFDDLAKRHYHQRRHIYYKCKLCLKKERQTYYNNKKVTPTKNVGIVVRRSE